MCREFEIDKFKNTAVESDRLLGPHLSRSEIQQSLNRSTVDSKKSKLPIHSPQTTRPELRRNSEVEPRDGNVTSSSPLAR